MKTIVIEILDDHAIGLLEHLESLNLIRMQPAEKPVPHETNSTERS